MYKFPADAPQRKVMKALSHFGFEIVRVGKHISLQRQNPNGTITPLTIPNHRKYRKGTLRTIINQANIDREKFLEIYYHIK